MIKGVIFDPAHLFMKSDRAWEYCCKKFNLTKKDLLELRKELIKPAKEGKLSKDELLIKLSNYFNIDLTNMQKELEIGGRMFDFNNKVLDLIKQIDKSKYKIGLISNTTELFASLHDEGNLYNQFENVILSFEVKALKPNKVIYKKMLQKLNLKSDECVYIDVKERNIQTAQELGMKTILFKKRV